MILGWLRAVRGRSREAEKVQAELPFRVRKVSGGIREVKIDPRRSKNDDF